MPTIPMSKDATISPGKFPVKNKVGQGVVSHLGNDATSVVERAIKGLRYKPDGDMKGRVEGVLGRKPSA